MVKNILTFILIIILSLKIFTLSSQTPIWTIGTAKTISKNETQLNMFYFSMHGLTNRLELQAKPLTFLALPAINLKKTWYYKKSQKNLNYLKSRNLIIGSIHGINYPTLTLKLARNRGFRNLMPLTTEIPHILAIRNEILFSSILKNKTSCDPSDMLLTLTIGTKFALRTKNSTLPYFENPFLFRETSIYHNKLLWYIGLGLDGHFSGSLNYSLDFDYKSVGLKSNYRAFENNTLLYWQMGKRDRLRLAFGFKASMSNFPYKKTGVFPLFDLTYMFKSNKANGRDLFEPGTYDPFDDRENEFKEEKPKKKKKEK